MYTRTILWEKRVFANFRKVRGKSQNGNVENRRTETFGLISRGAANVERSRGNFSKAILKLGMQHQDLFLFRFMKRCLLN